MSAFPLTSLKEENVAAVPANLQSTNALKDQSIEIPNILLGPIINSSKHQSLINKQSTLEKIGSLQEHNSEKKQEIRNIVEMKNIER